MRIFQIRITVTTMSGIELGESNDGLSIGAESEPLSEENFGPVRK